MLGKVFENLEVIDRKAKGTYYTPREIVHYMCQESLINYLDTQLNTGEVSLAGEHPTNLKLFGAPATQQYALKTTGYTTKIPHEEIEEFIRHGELAVENDLRVASKGETETYSYIIPSNIRLNAAKIDQALAGIRVCDPAVGSGAFLVGMMTEIVRARSTLNIRLGASGRSNYDFKRHAIQQCLYGVDIDPGAVEIAKLRLWLSLVVDEENIKQIKPLPNLDYKIVCGNSLLKCEQNILYWPLYNEIEKLRAAFFDETNRNTKDEIKQQINKKLAEIEKEDRGFNFTVDFSEVFPKDSAANRGFDIVIANPPYVRQEKISGQKPELKKYFQCFDGTADIYVYFYERGRQILKKNGILTFISSNKYFRAGYGEKLRRYLANTCEISRIIDFGDAPVFEAIAYPSIIILKNASPDDNTVSIYTWQPGPPLAQFADIVQSGSASLLQRELTSDGWRLESPVVLRLLEKLWKAGKPLGEYVNGRFYRGIVTGLNEAFVVDRPTRDRLIVEHKSSAEVLKPLLRGRDIKRWYTEYQDLWLIFTRRGINIDKYPAIKKYLSQYKKQLEPGIEGGRKPGSYEWYEIQDNIAYWEEFEKPKIAYPNICKRNEFAWEDEGYYINQKAFIIPEASKYLLGILNSSVVTWLFDKLLAKLQNGYYEPSSIFIKDFPIPVVAKSEPIETLVNKILALKKDNPDFDVSALEQQIDQLVYELYGLMPEEIVVVESIH